MENARDIFGLAFNSILLSAIVTFVLGRLISKTIRPGFKPWVFGLFGVGLLVSFAVAMGFPIIAIGAYQFPWVWVFKLVVIVVSLAISTLAYWGGANSFALTNR